MNLAFLQDIATFSPAWFALALAGLAAGFGAGWLYFRSLATVARRFVEGDWTAILFQIGRIAALGLLLYVFARIGAHVLLAAAAGILLARRQVLARTEAGT